MRSIYNKQTQKNRATRFIVIIVIIVTAITAGALWYITINKPANNSVTNSDTAGNNGTSKEDVANNTVPSGSTSQDVPVQENLSAQITQLEQTNTTVIIAGAVNGATEGTCVAEFTTPNDRPVTKQVAATKDGTQAKCGPITINEVEFSYLGEWQVTLKFYTPDNTKQATAETKNINIQ